MKDLDGIGISKKDYERAMSQGKREDMQRLLEYKILKFAETKKRKGTIQIGDEFIPVENDLIPKEKIRKEEIENNNLKEDVLTLIALKRPRDATEKIVKSFIKNNYIYSTRDDEKSEMWIYEDGIYLPQGKTFIKEFCRLLLGKVYTTTLTNEVIEKIRVETYIDQDEFFKTNYVYEIPILDGILNVKTRKISPFTPKKIFFNKIPLNYKPEQKCKKINKFFRDVLSDEGDIKVMYEILGSLLVKDYFIEKAIMFNGKGRNGKSKTLRLMEKFVGSENVCNVGISSMQKDNFDLEDLFGNY